jgi:queuine/archaeosine tRNA-ribosyltransferase
MADICIFYSGSSKFPEKLAAALSPPWTVWWDKEVISDFTSEIKSAIDGCVCVIPIWSKEFEGSAYGKDEVNYSKSKGKIILPVKFFENDVAPMGFGNFDIVNLTGWNSDNAHSGFQDLSKKLRTVVSNPKPVEYYKTTLGSGTKNFKRPTFYYSISSYDTRIAVTDAIDRLQIVKAPNILVSAYDIKNAVDTDRANILSKMATMSSNGATIMLDSGQYEATRKEEYENARDINEKWSISQFHEVLSVAEFKFSLCFDTLTATSDISVRTREAIEAFERDSKATSRNIVPIVHATTDADGIYNFGSLEDIAFEVSRQLKPAILAIPERELGMGLIARSKEISDIRKRLETLNHYQPLHILGTGNPVAVALFTMAGADSFDGLEWCRVAIDGQRGQTHHMHNFDLIKHHSVNMRDDLCKAMAFDESLEYVDRVLFNNYGVISEFVGDLQRVISTGDYAMILRNYVESEPLNKIMSHFKKTSS